MMPEYFGSLSDKQGPLCSYFKYHAWKNYGWCPSGAAPQEPEGYASLEWRYLPAIDNPHEFIEQRMKVLDNQRVRMLNELMVPHLI